MKRLTPVLWVLLFVGAAAFIHGVAGRYVLRAWESYLVNFLFWTGLAQGAVVFAPVLALARAGWGSPFVFTARACSGFLPVSLVLYALLYFGRLHIFPWMTHPFPGKEAWLSFPFLYFRDGLALFLYMWAGFRWVKASVSGRSVQTLSPVVILLFVGVSTLLSWDLIMCLDPKWTSTLLGGYYFIGSFYSGMAALVPLSLLLPLDERGGNGSAVVTPDRLHDLGRLLFAFCLFWMAMFWAQYLAIWFGNLPEESRFVYLRIWERPWIFACGTVFVMGFLLPFVLLLDRQVKRSPVPLSLVSLLVLVGMWLERYILVVPSLSPAPNFPLGWMEVLITLGFASLFLLSWSAGMRRFSAL